MRAVSAGVPLEQRYREPEGRWRAGPRSGVLLLERTSALRTLRRQFEQEASAAAEGMPLSRTSSWLEVSLFDANFLPVHAP